MSGARSRRFKGGLAPAAAKMNSSVSFDKRLLSHDVAGSKAHARMLEKQGVLTSEDADAISRGLDEVRAEFEEGKLEWVDELEDVHMNVESQLTKKIGDAARRLHTGRSRNDQVATDLRLYARDGAEKAIALLDGIRGALVAQAESTLDFFVPGYTHLQRAQPVRLAHHLMAYEAMFSRDRDRLSDALKRINVSPLGSGALASTTFPLDREHAAKALGFDSVSQNSMDAVGDRDFAIELIATLALCQVHLSRLGEEVVLWMSQEFGFASSTEAYCSGSSIMPQKVNPDIAELVRGKSGRVIGDWVALITVLKGLPLAYNKDLQESQEPLYDAIETVTGCLEVCAGMVSDLEFHKDRMKAAVEEGYVQATELADYLASKGLPFREGHDVAGALVRFAIEKKKDLASLTLVEMKAESDLFEQDVFDWLDVGKSVDRRDLVGGPARKQIVAQIKRVREELGQSKSL